MKKAKFPPRQHGAVLVMALIMLVMITLFAVSMVRLSNSNMQVVGNMQMQRSLEANAQQAVENSISGVAFFNDSVLGVNQFATNNYVDSTINNTTVRVKRPVCVAQEQASGYTLGSPLNPQDNVFEVTATATDNVSGASVEIVQGFKVRMAVDTCLYSP